MAPKWGLNELIQSLMFKGFSGNRGYVYTTGFSENFIFLLFISDAWHWFVFNDP